MLNETRFYCPECDEGLDLPKVRSRRDFFKAMGGAAAVAAVGAPLARARGEATPKPAETGPDA